MFQICTSSACRATRNRDCRLHFCFAKLNTLCALTTHTHISHTSLNPASMQYVLWAGDGELCCLWLFSSTTDNRFAPLLRGCFSGSPAALRINPWRNRRQTDTTRPAQLLQFEDIMQVRCDRVPARGCGFAPRARTLDAGRSTVGNNTAAHRPRAVSASNGVARCQWPRWPRG